MNSSEPHWVLKTNERTWNFQNVKVEANGAEVRPHDRSVVGINGSHMDISSGGGNIKRKEAGKVEILVTPGAVLVSAISPMTLCRAQANANLRCRRRSTGTSVK